MYSIETYDKNTFRVGDKVKLVSSDSVESIGLVFSIDNEYRFIIKATVLCYLGAKKSCNTNVQCVLASAVTKGFEGKCLTHNPTFCTAVVHKLSSRPLSNCLL